MKKLALLIIFLAACSSVTFEEHNDAGSKYLLNNGLVILMKENPDTGMVAIDFMIKKSIAADREKHGLGYLTHRLLLAGTTTRSREQILNDVETVGGSITAKTYAEYSEIVAEVPSNKFSIVLEVLQDVILNPAFTPEEIEREKIAILGELNAKKDQPGPVTEDLFMKTLYENHPYQHPIEGYEETITSLTREDIINHYNSWYVPNAIIISIVGNIKEKPTLHAVQRIFGKMKPSTLPPEGLFELPPRTSSKKSTHNMPIESFYIQYGHQLVPATHPDFIKLRMANAVLGSGASSRLFYELREKRALAYRVFSIAPSVRTIGFLKVTMISRPAVLNESLVGIQEQLTRLQTEPVTEEELNIVKQKVKGFFFLDHQKTTDQANYLGLYEMQGLGYHYDKEYPDKIGAVSSEEVQTVANQYFVNPVIAVLGPFEGGGIE
ncbi:insulinase family protein [Candidatus Woesearchaeota archaeon]|nr:insulinase family protein [Candidatus Woesearchaeota archaeon]